MVNWEANWERDALRHIVALLFALAGLADLAAGASFRRRRQVLGILNCGEAVARAFVIAMVCGEPTPVDVPEPDSDAAHFAVRLRALALILCLMLARRVALPGAGVRHVDRQEPALQAGRRVALPVSDTS